MQLAAIVTDAATVDTSPQSFDARSQNDVALRIGPIVEFAMFAFATGCDTSCVSPSYHWNASGSEPLTAAATVIESPITALPPCGCTRIDGAVHGVTVMMIVSLRANAPQLFVASTQYAVVAGGETLIDDQVAPSSGVRLSGAAPAYH